MIVQLFSSPEAEFPPFVVIPEVLRNHAPHGGGRIAFGDLNSEPQPAPQALHDADALRLRELSKTM